MKMTTRMELRPLSELIPYARNAREHSEEQIRQLRSSLREFGFVAPLLIDARGNILAGHGRLTAAAAEGLAEVPCVLVEHLTDVQRRAYILADNRLAEQASWNEELVSLELQELQDAGFELDLTGFDAAGLHQRGARRTIPPSILLVQCSSCPCRYLKSGKIKGIRS